MMWWRVALGLIVVGGLCAWVVNLVANRMDR
jgi:hypothetical protein